MSDLEQTFRESDSGDCPPTSSHPVAVHIPTRDAVLGEGMTIRRALPSRQRRMVGAWCFLDHFGPVDSTRGKGLRVGPHPHTCLQTFTWPLSGEILHRDSLGCVQLIRPGQVNLMTAGRGISHSEESPQERSPSLHGAQLWIALPDHVRYCEPAFEHYPKLPVVELDRCRITVLVGETAGEHSPVCVHSPLSAVDVEFRDENAASIELRPDFEYGALVLEGEVVIEDVPLQSGALLYLGCGRDAVSLRSEAAGRLLIIGGEPFREEILMWWNFVGRDREELAQAVFEWNAGDARYGEVLGYPGNRLAAPVPPWSAR